MARGDPSDTFSVRMSGRAIFILRTLAITALLSSACDRRPAAAPLPPSTQPLGYQLEIKPLTPLLPARDTHVAVDSLGNVYWVQESDRGDDTLFVIGEGEIP